MKRTRGKILILAPRIPTFFMTGASVLPNRLKAARDSQTSITRKPPGIGPAMCASTPFTGQSASRLRRPFRSSWTLFWYLARALAPGKSITIPIGMGGLLVWKDARGYEGVSWLTGNTRAPYTIGDGG